MSNGWSSKDVTFSTAGSQVVGASATKTAISRQFPITAGGSLNGVIKVMLSGVTVTTGVTVMLQTADGQTAANPPVDDWVDSKTATVLADGAVYIKWQTAASADQTYLPLLNKGRVVLTTGINDAATVTSVSILQEL